MNKSLEGESVHVINLSVIKGMKPRNVIFGVCCGEELQWTGSSTGRDRQTAGVNLNPPERGDPEGCTEVQCMSELPKTVISARAELTY